MGRVLRAQLSPEVGDEAARRYLAGETAQAVADALGTSQSKILRELEWRGIKRRSRREAHTKHPLRHDALDILTPEAAYWCGFLFTDGSVLRRAGQSPVVAVGLSACDRGHLEKLRAFLGSTHAIAALPPRENVHRSGMYTSRAACRFAVRSDRLAERLLALGRYDGPVDERLAQSRDFWRGAVDGDGTIGVSCGAPFLKLVGSRRLLEAYVRFLGRVGTRRLHVRPHKTIFCVSTSGSTAERVIDRLYSGATTALDRKAAKAVNILAQVPAPDPRPEPRWLNGGGRRALINAKGTMCAQCMGDVVVSGGRVRLEHEADCAIGFRLAARRVGSS